MLNEQNEGADDESNNGSARGGEAGRRVNREGGQAVDGTVGSGAGGGGAAHEPSLGATIPLTPQDRQAIERVNNFFLFCLVEVTLRNPDRLPLCRNRFEN